MITDEQLDKRVEEIMSIVTMTDDRDQNFRRFVRAALEVDRESLRLLEHYRRAQTLIAAQNTGEVEAHITALRKRLGIE